MFKKSFGFKLSGIFCALVFALNCFAWPWDTGARLRKKFYGREDTQVKYQDPLLPFIHADKKVTHEQFRELLMNISADQRKELWKALTGKDAQREISAGELEEELHRAGKHWITYRFTQFDYHETVQYAARKLGVNNDECSYAATFQLERRIMEKIFAGTWDKLSEDERRQKLAEAGLEPDNIAAYSAMTAAVLSGLSGTASGWTAAGIATVAGALLTGGPNVAKTAAFIVGLHSIKVDAMKKSGTDIAPYVLK